MTENSIPQPAVRGRPRSERSHRAILEAANELLAERGFVDLTIEEVAQRAKVSKSTIYRRWPTKGTLVGLISEIQRDPELAEIWRERFIKPVRDHHRTMVDRGIERGEVSPDADPDVILDLLYGAAYHRLLQSHLPLTDRFAIAVVTTVVAGVRAEPRVGAAGGVDGR